jgi:flavorubredoxin
MDAFGQHYATSERFDTQVPFCEAMNEAKTYYANIIMLYGGPVQKALKKLGGLPIEMIAPSHGIIWTKNIPEILEAYDRWSRHVPEKKVLIFYDSMWQSTRRMADAVAEGANRPEIRVRLYDVKAAHITVLAAEALDCAALAVGTPTLNKGMMPKIAEALTYLKGLAPEGKAALAFGSYGWAKLGGPVEVDRILREMKTEILREPIQAQYAPTEADLEACRNAGRLLAEAALQAGEPKQGE